MLDSSIQSQPACSMITITMDDSRSSHDHPASTFPWLSLSPWWTCLAAVDALRLLISHSLVSLLYQQTSTCYLPLPKTRDQKEACARVATGTWTAWSNNPPFWGQGKSTAIRLSWQCRSRYRSVTPWDERVLIQPCMMMRIVQDAYG
jgi:hypothetical protein